MTFWANNPLSTDIASLLMSRAVVAHQIWPGHQSDQYIAALAISFCDKDFSDKLQSWLHVENISNKKKQSEGTFESLSQRI